MYGQHKCAIIFLHSSIFNFNNNIRLFEFIEEENILLHEQWFELIFFKDYMTTNDFFLLNFKSLSENYQTYPLVILIVSYWKDYEIYRKWQTNIKIMINININIYTAFQSKPDNKFRNFNIFFLLILIN